MIVFDSPSSRPAANGNLDHDGDAIRVFEGRCRAIGRKERNRHEPRLAEVYVPFGNYLRFRAGLREPVREACVLAMARECNSAFEWAAHEPEALQVGVPADVIELIKFRKPTSTMEVPFGTVVQLIREAFTERSVSAERYDAAVSLLGVRFLSTSLPSSICS